MKLYIVKEDEEEIKVTFGGLTPADKILHILGYTALCFPFVFFSIIFFMTKNYVGGFLSLLGCVLMCMLAVTGLNWQKKREEIFCFSLTPKGICLRDIDGIFSISWSNVVSFGVVNHNDANKGHGRSYQDLLYFSTEIYDDLFMRKQTRFRCTETGSNEKMIVFPFGIDNAEGEYKAFCEYIYRYCDKEKEQNFIQIVV